MNYYNKSRIRLWNKELNKLVDIFGWFLQDFDLRLKKCSMERITFSKGHMSIHFDYAYDRYEMESNLNMPLGMIVFEKDTQTKDLITVFKEKITHVNFYQLMGELDKDTNDQALTFNIMLKRHVAELLYANLLF